MATKRKADKGKRIVFDLEFYWRGPKKRIPSVNFGFVPRRPHQEGDYDGLPNEILDGPEFAAFNKASHDFCKVLLDAGELD